MTMTRIRTLGQLHLLAVAEVVLDVKANHQLRHRHHHRVVAAVEVILGAERNRDHLKQVNLAITHVSVVVLAAIRRNRYHPAANPATREHEVDKANKPQWRQNNIFNITSTCFENMMYSYFNRRLNPMLH